MRIGIHTLGKELELGDHVIAWRAREDCNVEAEGVEGIVIGVDTEFVLIVSMGKTHPCDITGGLDWGVTAFYLGSRFMLQGKLSIEELLTHGHPDVRKIAQKTFYCNVKS